MRYLSIKPRRTTGRFVLITVLFIVFILSAAPSLRRVNSDDGDASNGAAYAPNCNYFEHQRLSGGGDGVRAFGGSVALSGDTAVVGAPSEKVGTASHQGAVYVFVRSGAAWTRQQQLFASDGAEGDLFGGSVSISGDYLVAGAYFKNIGANFRQGAAYVFRRSGTTWTQQQRLTAGDGASNDYFGWSVSISGSQVAVGAPEAAISGRVDQGAVYLFTRSGSTWTPEIKLTANDGAAASNFGSSVSLDSFLLVGAPRASVGANEFQGAAYVFAGSSSPLPGRTWTQRAKLMASDGAARDGFGASAASNGNTAVIGAANDKIGANENQGSAYVFLNTSPQFNHWSQQAKLMLSDGAAGDGLGASVALSGDIAVVGAPQISFQNPGKGAAFLFSRGGTTWSLQQRISASDGAVEGRFGDSVAIGGNTLVVGASGGGDADRGAAYILRDCNTSLVVSVSAASFASGSGLAPESNVAAFGSNLAGSTQTASAQPLPTELAGVSVRVKDGTGAERLAPLFFVSPGQINYHVPPGTSAGLATVTVTSGPNLVAAGTATVANVAPGLFAANANGSGVAAANALRVRANGTQQFESVARFDAVQNRFVAVPIDLGPEGDVVFLVLYGTGLRFRSALAAVSASIGGVNGEVLFAGPAPGFVGLDQVNVRLSRSLAGRGEVDLALIVDNKAANTVLVSIR